ncbi:MAG: CPBP family intramembrane glutamic endopeptidase [Candidatus Eisenbacteria bacterium]
MPPDDTGRTATPAPEFTPAEATPLTPADAPVSVPGAGVDLGDFRLAPALGPDPAAAEAELGLWVWFGIVAVAFAISVLFSETQLGLLAAAGGTFAVAHAVDRVERWRLLHHFLAGIVTAGGVVLCIATARFIAGTPLPALERHLGVAASIVAALGSAALFARPVVDALVRRLFRGAPSTHVTRLAVRMVAIALLMAAPLWVTFRGMLALDMLHDMDLGGSSLWGSLIGLTLLSLGGVGVFVRRSPVEALARLGLTPPAGRDLLWIPLGVLALAGLNGGVEWAQKTWFPSQWAFDQRVVGMMAGSLTRIQSVMLGVSAGFGEELSMRGALQPRLGLVLTAVLFAALHVQYSWTGMCTIVLFGLALGLVRMRSSTTTAIAIHAIYDMIAAFGAQQAR